MTQYIEKKDSAVVISESQQDKILARASEIKSKLVIDVPLTLPIIKIKTSIMRFNSAYAATNGRRLYIDPISWMALPNNEAEGVLYHEWCHIGLMHPRRMRSRIHKIWNYACDFFINYHIKHDMNSMKISIAPGMLYDSYYNSYNWFAEKIYDDLLAEVEKLKNSTEKSLTDEALKKLISKPNSDDKYCNRDQAIKALAFEEIISDIMAEDIMLPPLDNDDIDKEMIREIIRAAELHKKSRGNLPGFYEKNITKLRRARVPWENIFHDMFMELVVGSDDRSFARPKRWAIPFDMFLPSDTGVQKQDVVVIIDSSGSMYNENIFGRFIGELKKIMQYVNSLTLISADAAVHEKVSIDSIHDVIGENKKFHFRGGGGTDFVPALNAASKIRSDIVIYYTDGHGNFGTSCPPGISRLLWILIEDSPNNKPPFGRFIIAED